MIGRLAADRCAKSRYLQNVLHLSNPQRNGPKFRVRPLFERYERKTRSGR
jgi:hypothetical protein